MLQRALRASEENNIILKKMRSANRWATFFRFTYWLIIIGISVGSYYYIQPYVNTLTSFLGQLGPNNGAVNVVSTGILNPSEINTILQTLKAKK